MTHTCGSHLSQFALSVDSVDAGTYGSVRALLERYFEKTLSVSFYVVLVDGIRVDSRDGFQPGLKTLWSNRPVVDAMAIINEEGHYAGMRAYAYHKDRCLWVTAEHGRLLADPEAVLRDAWSSAQDLPGYLENGESDAKTAVIVPLRYGGRVFGVLVLEFPEHIECSVPARDEIRIIADALARIIWLHETTTTQLSDTQRAFRTLEELFNATSRPLKKPKMFISSSDCADEDVIGTIRSVVGEFEESCDVVYWKEISEQGSIDKRIMDEISSSAFGICYMSEKISDGCDGEVKFRDNPNVLFEAGMFHALTSDPAAFTFGWIPIRESNEVSGPAPFNFAHEYMIVVPRSSGQLNREDFRARLRSSLSSLVAV